MLYYHLRLLLNRLIPYCRFFLALASVFLVQVDIDIDMVIFSFFLLLIPAELREYIDVYLTIKLVSITEKISRNKSAGETPRQEHLDSTSEKKRP